MSAITASRAKRMTNASFPNFDPIQVSAPEVSLEIVSSSPPFSSLLDLEAYAMVSCLQAMKFLAQIWWPVFKNSHS
jgi:hypothetical protein